MFGKLLDFMLPWRSLERKIDLIWNTLVTQTRKLEKLMSASDELQGLVTNLKGELAGLRQDVTDLKNNLPEEGGMTAAEVAALRASLTEAVADAAELNAETPGTPTPAPAA